MPTKIFVTDKMGKEKIKMGQVTPAGWTAGIFKTSINGEVITAQRPNCGDPVNGVNATHVAFTTKDSAISYQRDMRT